MLNRKIRKKILKPSNIFLGSEFSSKLAFENPSHNYMKGLKYHPFFFSFFLSMIFRFLTLKNLPGEIFGEIGSILPGLYQFTSR